MTIRVATPADYPQIILLWQLCGLVRPWNDPEADLDRIANSAGGTLLIGETDGAVIATAMAGFDGHRGWIYYLAVHPDHQGNGHGRTILNAAEAWLKDQDCPKVELIVREDNQQVLSLYSALGYGREHRALMAKWLIPPPAPSPDHEPPRIFDVTITYLEMRRRPARAVGAPPIRSGERFSLQRAETPTLSFYRFLHYSVGDPWLWTNRRKLSDQDLLTIIHDPKVEIYVPWVNGVPAGFVELDFRPMPDRAEIAYFGLLPEFIGRGIGPYLLDWAIDCAWNREPSPKYLTVNTCTLDHPKALQAYQRAGFEVTERKQIQETDPIPLGVLPRDTKVLSPGY